MVSSEPTISKIADFLNHLFTVKNLKPATIAGYRTAIADHLGYFGLEVSKSLDLNRLIASFYRDKPTANRGIPSWDLSLALLALTKAPFEPLKHASLKILTFKTVFLMALASGKRRGGGGQNISWLQMAQTYCGRSSFKTFPELGLD